MTTLTGGSELRGNINLNNDPEAGYQPNPSLQAGAP